MAFQKIGGVAGAPNHSGTLSSSSLQQASDNLEKKIDLLVLQVFRKPSEEVFEKSSKVQNSGNITLSQLAGKIDTLQKKIDFLAPTLPSIQFPIGMLPLSFTAQSSTSESTSPISEKKILRPLKQNATSPLIVRDLYISDRDAKLIGRDQHFHFSETIYPSFPIELDPHEPYFYIGCTLIDPTKRVLPQEVVFPSYLFKDKTEGEVVTFRHKEFIKEAKDDFKIVNYYITLRQASCLREGYDTTTTFEFMYRCLESALWHQNVFAFNHLPYKYSEDIPEGNYILKGSIISPEAQVYNPSSLIVRPISKRDIKELKAMDPRHIRLNPESLVRFTYDPKLSDEENKRREEQCNSEKESYKTYLEENPFLPISGKFDFDVVKEKNGRFSAIVKIDSLDEKDIKVFIDRNQLFVIGKNTWIAKKRKDILFQVTSQNELTTLPFKTYDKYTSKEEPNEHMSFQKDVGVFTQGAKTVSSSDCGEEFLDYDPIEAENNPVVSESKNNASILKIPTHKECLVRTALPIDRNSVEIYIGTCANKVSLSAITNEELETIYLGLIKQLPPSEIIYETSDALIIKGYAKYTHHPRFVTHHDDGTVSLYADDYKTNLIARGRLSPGTFTYLNDSKESVMLAQEAIPNTPFFIERKNIKNGSVAVYTDASKSTDPIRAKIFKQEDREKDGIPLFEPVVYLDRSNKTFIRLGKTIYPETLLYTDHREDTDSAFVISDNLIPSEKYPHKVLVISFTTQKNSDEDSFKTLKGKEIDKKILADLGLGS